MKQKGGGGEVKALEQKLRNTHKQHHQYQLLDHGALPGGQPLPTGLGRRSHPQGQGTEVSVGNANLSVSTGRLQVWIFGNRRREKVPDPVLRSLLEVGS